MAKRFLRECYISILETPYGQPPKVIKQVWGYDQNPKATIPTGLRLSFTIDKQLTDIADTAVLRIYNLNRESRLALAQRSIYLYKSARVRTLQINAGYENELGALFNGGIERVTNTRRGPDWITEIKASSALSQIMFNVFDKSWQSDVGTPAIIIFEESLEKGGLKGAEKTKVTYSPGAERILRETKMPSFLAEGNIYDTVQKLMRSLKLVMTNDIGKTIVVEPGNPIDPSDWLTVSELTGLVGSPLIDDMGYEFRTLIDHRISVGELVKVSSQTLEESTPGLEALGTVWTMNIRGDTHEDDWYMDVKTMFYPPQFSPLQNMPQQPAIQDVEDFTP